MRGFMMRSRFRGSSPPIEAPGIAIMSMSFEYGIPK